MPLSRHATRHLVAGILALTTLRASFVGAADAPPSPPHASHVVVVIMDGLRPDSVTPQDMPTLYALGREGTFFAHHHPVYLSSTEVNGTAIATGAYPSHDGVMANKEYRPGIELLKPIAMENEKAVRKGDKVSNGQYLRLPTVAEIAQAAGKSAVVAGTKPVALLLARAPQLNGGSGSTLFEGQILPAEQQTKLEAAEGKFPKVADPKKSANAEQDAWTTRILTRRLWANGVPNLTMLWLSEPDYAQHGSGPNSATARSALRSSDDNLAIVLQALDAAHVRTDTDILVVSDHGFSTVRESINLVKVLAAANFDPVERMPENPKGDEVLIVPLGGSTSFYVPSKNAALVQRLTAFLQSADFTGVVFTRDHLPGTFGFEQVHIDTPDAPDVVLSFRWFDEKSATGMPGLIESAGDKAPGQGNHTSLSRYDMHNTLIAAGPDFRKSFTDDTPSGNSDIAPTVLHLLGLPPSPKMDGRILVEALANPTTPLPPLSTTTVRTEIAHDGKIFSQYITYSQVGSTVYFDAGNALPDPTAPVALDPK